ncbi:aminotransferase class V-fold PLP-dependent enzyme, partial [Chitinimonas sp.]|uniref:aminotransferase class V-fold PLP-dependent enzyme n=1 Tax=Chitinimonas sp. TaxID=1934313 RepID=UPI0035AEE47D
GKLLVLVNGAYGKRMARLTEVMGRQVSVLDFGETAPVDPVAVAQRLIDDPNISHVGLIYCETSTGILNPLAEVAAVVAQAGRKLIIDAMSAFGALPLSAKELAFDAVIASSNKCLEGVPGMGFVLARREALAAAQGNAHSLSLDLHDQWQYMQKTGQWRYTPPTHVVAAFRAALDQFDAEGGRVARMARYQANWPASFPTASLAGTHHRHGACTQAWQLAVPRILRAGQGTGLRALSGQAHRAGDLPGRLHRCHRPERHAGSGGGDGPGAARDGHPQRLSRLNFISASHRTIHVPLYPPLPRPDRGCDL